MTHTPKAVFNFMGPQCRTVRFRLCGFDCQS